MAYNYPTFEEIYAIQLEKEIITYIKKRIEMDFNCSPPSVKSHI